MKIGKRLRRILIENQAISDFSGQKSGTRVILNSHFYIFLKLGTQIIA